MIIQPEMLEAVGALESGVLLPTCNIKEELSKMDPKEARKAKRKWRKLRRSVMKHERMNTGGAKSSYDKFVRYYVRRKLRGVGAKKLGLM
jgi:hypothetical protein